MSYRTPPFTINAIYAISQLADQIDWGQLVSRFDAAWKRGEDGSGVRVGVLDTGVDAGHADYGDLKHVIARDATGKGPWDKDGHGTHCLGIVGAIKGGGRAIGGAFGCELYSYRCMVDGGGTDQWIAKAIDMAREDKCDIISLSLGSPSPSPTIAAALERYVKTGGFAIAAAGNNGQRNGVEYPGRWSGAGARPFLDTIAVAAVVKDGDKLRIDKYSAQGPEVDFAASGTNVTSCWLRGHWATISGTSMACPNVAAAAAVALSADRKPGGGNNLKTMADMREHLRRGAIDIEIAGKDHASGFGIVNVDAASERELPAELPAEDAAESEIDLGCVKLVFPNRDSRAAAIRAAKKITQKHA